MLHIFVMMSNALHPHRSDKSRQLAMIILPFKLSNFVCNYLLFPIDEKKILVTDFNDSSIVFCIWVLLYLPSTASEKISNLLLHRHLSLNKHFSI